MGRTVTLNDAQGHDIATTYLPDDSWQLTDGTMDNNIKTLNWPFMCSLQLNSSKGEVFRYHSALCYEQKNKSYKAATAMYGANIGQTGQYDLDMPRLEQYLDSEAIKQTTSQLYLIGNREIPVVPENRISRQQGAAALQQQKQKALQQIGGQLDGVYFDQQCRIYGFSEDGREYRMAVFATLKAAKMSFMNFGGNIDMSEVTNALGDAFNKAVDNASQNSFIQSMADKGLLGGIIGKKIKENRDRPATEEREVIPAEQPDEYQQFVKMGGLGLQNIEWTVDPTFVLIAPAESFDAAYAGEFVQICAQTGLTQTVMNYRQQVNDQMEQQIQDAATQYMINSRMNTQAILRANQQLNDAYARQNAAWRANSNATFEANRARSNAQFNNSAPDYSEAIRGVNTWVDDSGYEHQMSVNNDQGWINSSGDTIGTDKTVDFIDGFTKMNKK